MSDLPVPPRLLAQISLDAIKLDVKHKTVSNWTHMLVGRLNACASITQDWEIIGWKNEGNYLANDYANRHNLRW